MSRTRRQKVFSIGIAATNVVSWSGYLVRDELVRRPGWLLVDLVFVVVMFSWLAFLLLPEQEK